MLVLTRKPNEVVVINCQCGIVSRVTLVELRSQHARIGFDGPPELKFLRHELLMDEEFDPAKKPERAHGSRTVPIGNGVTCTLGESGLALSDGRSDIALDAESVRVLLSQIAAHEQRRSARWHTS